MSWQPSVFSVPAVRGATVVDLQAHRHCAIPSLRLPAQVDIVVTAVVAPRRIVPARCIGMAAFVERTAFTAVHAATVIRPAATVVTASSAVTVTGAVVRMAAVMAAYVAMSTPAVAVMPCLSAAHRRLVRPVLHDGHRTEAYRPKQNQADNDFLHLFFPVFLVSILYCAKISHMG